MIVNNQPQVPPVSNNKGLSQQQTQAVISQLQNLANVPNSQQANKNALNQVMNIVQNYRFNEQRMSNNNSAQQFVKLLQDIKQGKVKEESQLQSINKFTNRNYDDVKWFNPNKKWKSIAKTGNVDQTLRNVLYDVNESRKFGPYQADSLGFNSTTGYLTAFPQWALSTRNKLQQKLNLDRVYSALQNLTPQQTKDLQINSKGLIKWNDDKQKWMGPVGRQVQAALNAQKNKQKNLRVTSQLAFQKLQPEDIQKYLPPIVESIVRSNQLFSKFGVGPVHGKGLPLYTGRWVNPINGKMQPLPKANQKYINPGVLQQKLGVLQAKILNKWNEFITSVDTFIKMSKKNPRQYWDSQIKGVNTKMIKQNQLIISPQRLMNQFKKYLLGTQSLGGSLFFKVLSKAPTPLNLGQINSILPTMYEISQKKGEASTEQKQRLRNITINMINHIQESYISWLNQVGISNTEQLKSIKDQIAFLKFSSNFLGARENALTNGLMKLSKMMLIPVNLKQTDFLQIQKNVQQVKQSLQTAIKQGNFAVKAQKDGDTLLKKFNQAISKDGMNPGSLSKFLNSRQTDAPFKPWKRQLQNYVPTDFKAKKKVKLNNLPMDNFRGNTNRAKFFQSFLGGKQLVIPRTTQPLRSAYLDRWGTPQQIEQQQLLQKKRMNPNQEQE